MRLLAGTLLVIDDSLPPVAWLETPLGFFDAPQLIQCRVCMKLKETNARNYRNIKKLDRWRTTCRKCEDKTAYGRRAVARANRIKLDPVLPEAVKAYEMSELPAVVANSRSQRLKRFHTAEHVAAFNAMWRKVAHIVAVRRQILAQLIQANRRLSPPGKLATLMSESWVVNDYVEAVLGLFTIVNQRLKEVDTWIDAVDGHLPPDHWQDAIKALIWHKRATGEYLDICRRMSPFEFTTRAERERLASIDPTRVLDSRDSACVRWVHILSRGRQTLQNHMYPGMAWPGSPTIDSITPDWMREYNGIVRQYTPSEAEQWAKKLGLDKE
jgi:hypothetical protein